MTTRTKPAAVPVLRATRSVLLDFDGPVCSIFAGLPAPQVAAELTTILTMYGQPIPPGVDQADPLDLIRHAGSRGPELLYLAERYLGGAELRAAETAEPTPGAAAFLVACRDTGRPVAIVSNNSAPAVTRYLDQVGLAPLVAHVEGRIPVAPELMKPHPTILRRALVAVEGAAASAVIVGDSTTDVQAGQAVGVRCLGYANKPGKDQRLRDAGADAVIGSMTELAELTSRTPAP